jgi:hypothetical protein
MQEWKNQQIAKSAVLKTKNRTPAKSKITDSLIEMNK